MRLKQLHFILFFLLLLFSTVSYGQKYVLCRPLPAGGGSGSGSTPPSSNMNIQMGPPMNPAATSGCGAVNMTAIPVFNLGSSGGGGISMFGTTRYGVDTIAYKWDTISSNAMSIASGHWSNAIPIGFRFCTFGHSVDSFLISKTGAISFNLSLRNDTVLNSIPSATHALPSSNYAASGIFTTSSNVAVNLLNTYTKVRIRNLGTYPCSKLLISFDSIPVLDTACSLRFMYSQIVLYESNLIDIHLKQAPVCNTNTLLLIGLQNDLRDSAFSVPNYNLGNQSIINQAWRFFPNVVDSLKFRVKLYKNRVLVSTTIYPATTGSTFSPTIPYIMSGPTPTYDTLHCTLEIFHTAQFCQNSGGGMSVGPVDAVYFKDNSSSPTNPPPPSAACAKTYAGTVVYIGGCSGVGPIIAGSGYQNSTNLTNVDFQGTNGIGNVPGLIANVSSTIVAPFTVSAVQYFLVINPAGCVFQTGFNYTMDWYEIDTLKAQSIQAATCANNGIGTITLQKPDVLFGQILPLTHSNSTIQSNWSLCIPTPPGLTQVSQYVFKGPPGTYTFEVSDVYAPSWFNNCNSGLSPCNNNACKACAEYLTVVIPNQTYTIYKQNATQYICPGSAYQINGHSYTATGSYFDTLVNIYGCDSIIQTNVVLSQTYQYNRSVNICQGQTYTDGTSSFTTAGNYTLHYQTVHGCDSIINLNLVVYPSYSAVHYDTICDNQSVHIGNYVHNQTGIYADTLSTTYGCDSVIIEHLLVKARTFTNIVERRCEGDSVFISNKIYTVTGVYHDTLVNSVGCDSVIISNLYFEHPSVDLVALSDTVLGAGETFEFLVNTGYASDSIISLTPVKQIDSIGNNKYSIRANGVVTINIVTETSLGCIASDSLTIREINIVLPTVFTPNGDNQNDIFIIRGGHAYELNRFFIVNRYGEIVFSTNDFSQGWDGTYQGVEQMVGTYQYVVEAHLRNSKKKFVLKGNLQLIR